MGPSNYAGDRLCSCAVVAAVRRSPFRLSWLTLSSKLQFALSDAVYWTSHYKGLNHEEFHEFIIDFFEADQTPEGKTTSKQFYDWWTRYASDSIPIFAVDASSSDKCSKSLLLLERPRPPQHGSHRSRFSESSAKPVHFASPLSFI